MQGTILIIDGASSTRAHLAQQLISACFTVSESPSIADAASDLRRARPALIISAMQLVDGSAAEARQRFDRECGLGDVPMIALSDAADERSARLEALDAGIDEVLSLPLDDMVLQARIRSLLRQRPESTEMHLCEEAAQFARPAAPDMPSAPVRQSRVAVVARDMGMAQRWSDEIARDCGYDLSAHPFDAIQPLMQDPVPDVIVIALDNIASGPGLRLIADLRSRTGTRDAILIAIAEPADAGLASDALDRGAQDAIYRGFDVAELRARIATQLRLHEKMLRQRDSLRNGLRAAIEDSMTGLYNRRYAMAELARMAGPATTEPYAVLLADIDHFKRINDSHGHLAGDAILTQAAARLRGAMKPGEFVARFGGEEFLIVLPACDGPSAQKRAQAIRQAFCEHPFALPKGSGSSAQDPAIAVSLSIGVTLASPNPHGQINGPSERDFVEQLIADADRALYCAKRAGRNCVVMGGPQPAAA